MTRVVTIDPGLNHVAYASWSPVGQLLKAELVTCTHESGTERAQKWRDIAWWVAMQSGLDSGEEILLVCEIPQIYEDHKTDKNDLIDLAGVVGAIASKVCCGRVVWSPVPRQWKGQLPKEISVARVDAKLSVEEKAKIIWPAKRLQHNVYDAIHLGLVYFSKKTGQRR